MGSPSKPRALAIWRTCLVYSTRSSMGYPDEQDPTTSSGEGIDGLQNQYQIHKYYVLLSWIGSVLKVTHGFEGTISELSLDSQIWEA